MLNELYALSEALSEMKINTRVWHREYKLLPKATDKNPCYRIWISEKGFIKGIGIMNNSAVLKIRKFGNNQASFPAFNVKPLYRLTDDHQIKMLEEMLSDSSAARPEHIREWLTNDNWHKSMKNIDASINDVIGRMLKMIGQTEDMEKSIFFKIIRAVEALDGGLRAALETYILSALDQENKLHILLPFLFHCGKENITAAEDVGNNLSVILDVYEWDDETKYDNDDDIEKYMYPVAHEYTTVWINDALIRADDTDDFETAVNGIDAFGSPHAHGESEPMPTVRLAPFDVFLRSMFHEQRCQRRYGNFNDDSYPIAKKNRVVAKQALEWLADRENEGVTWKRADVDEIAFVYPSKLSETQVDYVSLLGAPPEKENEIIEERFAVRVKNFIKVFSGIPPERQPEYIRIFSIKKMDRARSKVVLTRNCSPDWFMESAALWQKGCENVPVIDFVDPHTPYPLDVAKIVNAVWKRDGKQITAGKKIIKRMQYYQGIELMLDLPNINQTRSADAPSEPSSDSLSLYFLRILLTNTEGLMIYFGNGQQSGKFVTPYYAKVIAGVTAVIGLLLYGGGHEKEDYMEGVAFLLGQLLKACDELHTFYCKVERDGNVPPQLAGNSMFAYASDSPQRAVAQLGSRMKPYIAWAKQYRTLKVMKNEIPNNLVGWNFNLCEELCHKLSPQLNESTRFSEYDKAQLFLGYLASFSANKKSKEKQSPDTPDQIIKEEINNDK